MRLSLVPQPRHARRAARTSQKPTARTADRAVQAASRMRVIV